ncbi:rRNA (guanine-N1)-methyltransferase [Zafaria cholistanensis]|uniref:rRNA (Guanine-N1)-methyltransferase n=1 Tax=Zafaria cholistanensis TaxID=1682741 RepID=A0A5A7NMH0_9MICC|nr:methyltransferase domain-containing protein [Zafaria cholistanensis]GER22105.1 rRNA (guanine-N1)-methyltransferase [Zafaria cholistanensis]
MPLPTRPVTLLCPVCGEELERLPRTLLCAAGHRFDAARQGYFNLLTGRGTPFREDTAAMVAARAEFLGAGHYAPLAEAVAAAVLDSLPGAAADLRVLDAGAGTGYYLGAVMDSFRAATGGPASAVALDISRYAMRRAAKVPATTAVVWDLWRPLPLGDAAVDVVLNVFAPRNGDEFARVLVPGGAAVVATPLPGHLGEAAESLGLLSIAPDKEATVAAALGPGFAAGPVREVRTELRLDVDDAVRLAVMGPAGHHLDAAALRARLQRGGVPPVITAAFRVQAFTRR